MTVIEKESFDYKITTDELDELSKKIEEAKANGAFDNISIRTDIAEALVQSFKETSDKSTGATAVVVEEGNLSTGYPHPKIEVTSGVLMKDKDIRVIRSGQPYADDRILSLRSDRNTKTEALTSFGYINLHYAWLKKGDILIQQ